METKICKCCGRELPIDNYRVSPLGLRATCNECVTKHIMAAKLAKKQEKQEQQTVQNARNSRLQDFTPRELMQELARRGYVGVLKYTKIETIDISKI